MFTYFSRYFPSQAFSFAMFDYFKRFSDGTIAGNLIAGGWAGVSSTIVFYPLEFLRTRLAVDVGKEKLDRQFNHSFDWLVKILK